MTEILQKNIIDHVNDPIYLEKLYRKDKSLFKKAIGELLPYHGKEPGIQFWQARLAYGREGFDLLPKKDIIFFIIAVLFAGAIAKLPQWMNWEEDVFVQRNFSFIFFEMLLYYFAWKQQFSLKKNILLGVPFLIAAVFINWLPLKSDYDVYILSVIHLPVVMWSLVGFSFMGNEYMASNKRIEFLKFNGDLAVMSAILVLSGGLFSGITLMMFELIGINIEAFFQRYLLVWGLPAVPILATIIVRQNPELIARVSPLVARIFTPIVFITLLIFLGSMIYAGKDPYHDRDFLFVFNIVLIAVIAIIMFSISDVTTTSESRWRSILLAGLSVVAVLINIIAISAISYRLSIYGWSPNRVAVLGGNVLICTHLILVTLQLFAHIKGRTAQENIERTISRFLPYYVIWSGVVTFIFPFIFEMEKILNIGK